MEKLPLQYHVNFLINKTAYGKEFYDSLKGRSVDCKLENLLVLGCWHVQLDKIVFLFIKNCHLRSQ